MPDAAFLPKFLGKSSGAHLIRTAMSAKQEFNGVDAYKSPFQFQRGELWKPHPWEVKSVTVPKQYYDFPETELRLKLIGLYFAHANTMMPLFHRPTFQTMLDQNMHLRDPEFGAVLLLVCAIGARYTDDPRVMLEGEGLHSTGWKWYEQTQVYIRCPGLGSVSLYIIQLYCVSV